MCFVLVTETLKQTYWAFFGWKNGNVAINCGEKMEMCSVRTSRLFIMLKMGIVKRLFN
jgi:hypothetical protein